MSTKKVKFGLGVSLIGVGVLGSVIAKKTYDSSIKTATLGVISFYPHNRDIEGFLSTISTRDLLKMHKAINVLADYSASCKYYMGFELLRDRLQRHSLACIELENTDRDTLERIISAVDVVSDFDLRLSVYEKRDSYCEEFSKYMNPPEFDGFWGSGMRDDEEPADEMSAETCDCDAESETEDDEEPADEMSAETCDCDAESETEGADVSTDSEQE